MSYEIVSVSAGCLLLPLLPRKHEGSKNNPQTAETPRNQTCHLLRRQQKLCLQMHNQHPKQIPSKTFVHQWELPVRQGMQLFL